MNNALNGADLVAQWRNGREQGNPAGPLFAAGKFAEADIVNAPGFIPTTQGCSLCTGSFTIACC